MPALAELALGAETDDTLAARAVAGDEAAFGELYRRHAARLQGFIRARVAAHEDAEDLMQTVFLKAWRAIGGFRTGEAPFFAWLLAVASNTVVSARRKRRLPLARLDDPTARPASEVWETALVARLDAQAWLGAALPRLRPLQRQVLLLRFVEGLDHAEVAERVGRSSTAVRVVQHRALAALRGMAPLGKPDPTSRRVGAGPAD